MNRVIIKCSYEDVFAAVSIGIDFPYHSISELEIPSHKEQNRQIASKLAKECIDCLKSNNVTKVSMIVKGEQADVMNTFIDEFMNSEIKLMYIKDITPIPHNDCRIPRTRDRIPKMKKLAFGKSSDEKVTK